MEQVIQEQMENLYDVYQDHPDMNFRKTALYLLLLLRERKGTILEGMILAQGLIHSCYPRNNEEHTTVYPNAYPRVYPTLP